MLLEEQPAALLAQPFLHVSWTGECRRTYDDDIARERLMSAQRHYGFERRRRADIQKAKQEAKRQRKNERAESGATGPEIGEAQETGAPAGVWEWFSPSRGRTVSSQVGVRPDPDPPDDWILLTDVEPESDAPAAP